MLQRETSISESAICIQHRMTVMRHYCHLMCLFSPVPTGELSSLKITVAVGTSWFFCCHDQGDILRIDQAIELKCQELVLQISDEVHQQGSVRGALGLPIPTLHLFCE